MDDNKINVRIPDGTGFGLADIEAKAKSLGLNKSELVMKGISMMMNFDEVFLQRIKVFALGLHIPEWLVMQNMIIKRMANEAAEYEVYGGGTRVLTEFMLVGEGLERRSITGEELFNILKGQYVQEYEKKLVEQTLREERYGIPLQEKEKAVLIKHRCGNAWRESDEYKKVLEQEAYVKKFKEENGIVDEPEFDPDEIVTPEELAEWEKE